MDDDEFKDLAEAFLEEVLIARDRIEDCKRFQISLTSSSDTPSFLSLHLLLAQISIASLQTWARAEAEKRLEASGETYKYEPSPNSGISK